MARRPFFLLAAAGCRGAARVLAPEDNSAVPPCAAVGCVRRRLCETSPAHSGQLQRLHLQLSGKQWLQSDRRSGVLRGFHRLLSHRGYCVRFPRLRVPARAVSRPPGRCSGGVSREHCRRASRRVPGRFGCIRPGTGTAQKAFATCRSAAFCASLVT